MTAPLTPPLDLITTAVLDLLKGAGRTVYDHAYGGSPVTPAYPYAVLYSLTGGDADPMPDLEDDGDEVTLPFQVTAVSNLRNQCQQTGRVLRDRLIGKTAGTYAHPLALPTGWKCVRRAADPSMPGIDRTGDHPNAIYSQPARYLLTIARV